MVSYPVFAQDGFVAGPEGLEPRMEVLTTDQSPSPETHRSVFVVGNDGTEVAYTPR